MACERYTAGLTDLALGVPAPPELDAHLAACAACRDALERERLLVRTIDGALRDGLAREPSPALLARVRQRLGEPQRSRFFWPARLWALAAAAGLVLVALVLFRPAPGSRAPRPIAAVPAETPAPAPPSTAFVEETPSRPVAPVTALLRRRPARPAAPEVIVPPGQEEALRRYVVYVAGLGERWVDSPVLLPTSPLVNPALPAPGWIEPRPVESSPVSLNMDSETKE
jgi:hypothetical protein